MNSKFVPLTSWCLASCYPDQKLQGCGVCTKCLRNQRRAEMHIIEKIELAKYDDAVRYNDSDEKFLFCIDWLDISAHDLIANRMVELLEDRFETLLVEDV